MMKLKLRFYAELNDFLKADNRHRELDYHCHRRTSVKDLIESFGVPHTEVELILVNGLSVDFSYIVKDHDRISVYPEFESVDISPLIRLRPSPLRNTKFVIDANLGTLARYLRLLGFDCLYRNDYDDQTVARISHEEHRIVLTRDRALLQQKIITHGYFVREVKPRLQVKAILNRFDLHRSVCPFSRCTRCNGRLITIDKEKIIDRLEPLTKKYYEDFLICTECKQIYWQGSHHQRAQKLVKDLIENTA